MYLLEWTCHHFANCRAKKWLDSNPLDIVVHSINQLHLATSHWITNCLKFSIFCCMLWSSEKNICINCTGLHRCMIMMVVVFSSKIVEWFFLFCGFHETEEDQVCKEQYQFVCTHLGKQTNSFDWIIITTSTSTDPILFNTLSHALWHKRKWKILDLR